MNRNWIKHFVKDHLSEMTKQSFRNCHTKGVDSIMFDPTPAACIRLFIANEDHDLYRNGPRGNQLDDWSVGLHAHHCELDIEVVYGQTNNIDGCLIPTNDYGRKLTKWEYKSKISDGECKFTRSGDAYFALSQQQYPNSTTGCCFHICSDDYHTIYVTKGLSAAWFVYEGEENPHYDKACYSNNDLTKIKTDELYQPMTEEYLVSQLRKVGLLEHE